MIGVYRSAHGDAFVPVGGHSMTHWVGPPLAGGGSPDAGGTCRLSACDVACTVSHCGAPILPRTRYSLHSQKKEDYLLCFGGNADMSGSSSNDKDKNVLVNTLFMFQPREESSGRAFFSCLGLLEARGGAIGRKERFQGTRTWIATGAR